jgi:hypothetical protein
LRQSPRDVIERSGFLDLRRPAVAGRTIRLLQGEEQNFVDYVGGVGRVAGVDDLARNFRACLCPGSGQPHLSRTPRGLCHPPGENEEIHARRPDAGPDDPGPRVAEPEISLSWPRDGLGDWAGSVQFFGRLGKIPRKYVARAGGDS